MVEGSIPVGRGVDGGEETLSSCTEHHPFDALYRGEEHPLSGFLAIDVDFYQTTTDRQDGFDMIDLIRFIFP